MQANKIEFNDNYIQTLGFDFHPFNIRIENKIVKLEIWDISGQEIYRSLVSSFCEYASLFILIYAINE